MTSYDITRRKIFEHYSRNLLLMLQEGILTLNLSEQKNITIPENPYICPLCFHMFSIKDLDQSKKNPLTLEHIPPKSLGGRDLVLTCKKCNNISGQHYDSLLRLALETEQVFSKTGRGTNKIQLKLPNNKQLKGTMGFDGKIFSIIINKKSNPYAVKDYEQLMANFNQTIEIKYKVPPTKNYSFALMRITYLLMFYRFGYNAILNNNAVPITIQLKDLDRNEFDIFKTFQYKEFQKIGFFALTDDQGHMSFLVGFKMKFETHERIFHVLYPADGEYGARSYDYFQNHKGDQNITIFELGNNPNLLDIISLREYSMLSYKYHQSYF
jgi:hypothetical protein